MAVSLVTVHGRECVRGIDVSRWQGQIDWPAVAANRDFAVIKATGGDGGLYTDGAWARNRRAATDAGIPIGAYHFLGAGIPGAQQADHFLAAIQPYDLALPPVVDYEFHADQRTRPDARTLLDFLARMDERLGRTYTGPTGAQVSTVIYSGAPMADRCPAELGRYDLWLAAYLNPSYPNPGPDVTALGNPQRFVPAAWPTWSAWQCAGEDGRCPGVAGPCDQNVATTEWLARATNQGDDDMPSLDEIRTMVQEEISNFEARFKATYGRQITASLDQLDPRRAEGQPVVPIRDLVEQIAEKG